MMNFSACVVFEPKQHITMEQVREHLDIIGCNHQPQVDKDYEESILVSIDGGPEWQLSRSDGVWVRLSNGEPSDYCMPEEFEYSSTKVVDEKIGFSFEGPLALEEFWQWQREKEEQRRCE